MYKQIAYETYKFFSDKKGNEHIASEGALRYILKYLKRDEARTILEIGTGIGTVCYAIRRAVHGGYLDRDLAYYGTEANEFCKKKFKENLNDQQNVIIFDSLDKVPVSLCFDFVVVDGQDPALRTLPERLNRHGIVFIEGGRRSQINELKNLFNNITKRIFVIFSEIAFIKRPYGPFINRPYGGGAVMILEPRGSDYLYFLTRKIATKLKYRKSLIG